MPAEKRRSAPGLIQRLAHEPYRFEFFQAVRLLLAHAGKDGQRAELEEVGQTIRFRNSISLTFPPSEIEALEIEWHTADARDSVATTRADAAVSVKSATLTPSFMGLTGPSGILPRHYTQHVAEREIHHRDFATRTFLDIFTSRAVALFYRSWLKYRLHFQYEADRKNAFLPLVLSLAGMGLPGTRERLSANALGIADESLAHYAAALRSRPPSIEWFTRVVSAYFGIPCRAEQFVGQWFALPPQEQTRLGQANCVLGQTSLCGGRVWDRQSKVRLTIGPLRKSQFDDFLPHAAGAGNLYRLFRLMFGTVIDCEVRLVLDRRDVTPLRLDSRNGNARLGWNTRCGNDFAAELGDTSYLMKAGDTTH